jgi:hypothetical protein
MTDPSCIDCDGRPAHVATTPEGFQVWLCGSCEYKRLHPDASPAVTMPGERPPERLQRETLFPVE